MTASHKLHSFFAADDWTINGTLYDIYDERLDPTGYTMEWGLYDFDLVQVLGTADVFITIANAAKGEIVITIPSDKTKTIIPGDYTDALRLTKNQNSGTMWTGPILVKQTRFPGI
jgi:hypothetical protein